MAYDFFKDETTDDGPVVFNKQNKNVNPDPANKQGRAEWANAIGRALHTAKEHQKPYTRLNVRSRRYGIVQENGDGGIAAINLAREEAIELGSAVLELFGSFNIGGTPIDLINHDDYGLMADIHLVGEAPSAGGRSNTKIIVDGDASTYAVRMYTRDTMIKNLSFVTAGSSVCGRVIDINFPGIIDGLASGPYSPYTNLRVEGIYAQGYFVNAFVIGDAIGGLYAVNGENIRFENVTLYNDSGNPSTTGLWIPNTSGQVKNFSYVGGSLLPSVGDPDAGVCMAIARAGGSFQGVALAHASVGIYISDIGDFLDFRGIDTEVLRRGIVVAYGGTAPSHFAWRGCRFDCSSMHADGQYVQLGAGGPFIFENCNFHGADPTSDPFNIGVGYSPQGTLAEFRGCTLPSGDSFAAAGATHAIFEPLAGQSGDSQIVMDQCKYTHAIIGGAELYNLRNYRGTVGNFASYAYALLDSELVGDYSTRPTTFTDTVTVGDLTAADIDAATLTATGIVSAEQAVLLKVTGIGSFTEYPLVMSYGRDTDIGVAGMAVGALFTMMNASGAYEASGRIVTESVLVGAADMVTNMVFEVRARGGALITDVFGLYGQSTGLVTVLVGTDDATDFNTAGFAKVLFKHGDSKFVFREYASGNAYIGVSNNTESSLLQAYQGDVNIPQGALITSSHNTSIITNAVVRSYWNTGYRFFQCAANTAPTDADIKARMFTAYLDETLHKLMFRVKYADGTTLKTGEVALT